MGVDSVDSSSYVKLAADGKKWSHPDFRLEDPSTPELLNLAIQNLATASTFELPLAVADNPLKSCSREVEARFPF
jgi:helicase